MSTGKTIGLIKALSGSPSGGGASLPEAGPYEYLVTDGEGKWGTAERLAWKGVVKVPVISEQTSIVQNTPFGGVAEFATEESAAENCDDFVEGTPFIVIMNGVTRTATLSFTSTGPSLEFDDENFKIVFAAYFESASIMFGDDSEIGTEYTLAAFAEVNKVSTIPAVFLLGNRVETETDTFYVMGVEGGQIGITSKDRLYPPLIYIQGSGDSYQNVDYDTIHDLVWYNGVFPKLYLTGEVGLPILVCQAYKVSTSGVIELVYVDPYSSNEIYRLEIAKDGTVTRLSME